MNPLQWGRALVSAEGWLGLDLTLSNMRLQWGRALVSAEGEEPEIVKGSVPRFNGAALW